MKIHEFQAKKLLSAYAIPIPEGRAVRTAEEASAFAKHLGRPVVVKVQIHAGGRGKADGVKKAATPEEAEGIASHFLGSLFVTEQTGRAGRVVSWILAEEECSVAQEFYVSITIDRKEACSVLLASSAGGMEIERTAHKGADGVAMERIDPTIGLRPFQASRIGFSLGLDPPTVRQLSGVIHNLYRFFTDKDCSLAEINPLALLESGEFTALDAKLTFDDNALFRHPDIASLRDPSQDDPREAEAARHNLNYIKLDGSVGCMVNGAGLAMATMDLIKLAGSAPANFLDIGGGATVETVREGMKILAADRDVKAIFVNIFGGIVRCDVVAHGVAAAARELDISLPVVVRIEGTNVEAGRSILASCGLNFVSVPSMKAAAEKLGELVKQPVYKTELSQQE
jgi:succinyl-CoA synthetase beta subunit